MTCIAVCRNRDGKLMMAGERKVTIGEKLVQYMSKPKIVKRNGLLLGAAGGGSLCTRLVEYMKLPKFTTTPAEYMLVSFLKAVQKELKDMGFVNKAGEINIPESMECTLLVVIKGELHRVAIFGPDDEGNVGYISIDEMETPYAVGSGASVAIASLVKDKQNLKKPLARTHLEDAIKLACHIDPFCGYLEGGEIDVIIED